MKINLKMEEEIHLAAEDIGYVGTIGRIKGPAFGKTNFSGTRKYALRQ